MGTVEALGVDPVEMAHAPGKVAVWGMDQEVIMVGHQGVGTNLEVPVGTTLLQYLQKLLVISDGGEDFLFSPATVHHVVPAPWIFYA